LPEILVDIIGTTETNSKKESESIKEKDDNPDIPTESFKQSNTENSQIIDFTTVGQHQLKLLKNAVQKHYKE
jgi:hypothetical protein